MGLTQHQSINGSNEEGVYFCNFQWAISHLNSPVLVRKKIPITHERQKIPKIGQAQN